MANKNESNNFSREETRRLVKQYELSLRENENIYFEIDGFLRIIEFYEENIEFSKALQTAELATEHYPFSAILKIKCARFLDELGYEDEAIEILEQSKYLDASETEYYLLKSEILARNGNYQQAIDLINKGLKFADKFEKFEFFLNLSDIYESKLQLDEMFVALKSAALIYPNDFEVAERLLFCIDELAIQDEGIKLFNEILDKDPFAKFMWYNLGQCYAAHSLYEKALEAYNFAIALNENYYDAIYEKAECLYELKKYHEALEYYLEASTLKEASEELLYSLGFTYYHLNNHQLALKHFRKTIELDPFYDEAYFQIAKIKEQHGFFETALSFYEKAIQLNLQNKEYVESIANLHFKAENYEEAIDYLSEVVTEKPSSKFAWLQLAASYNALEQKKEADEILQYGIAANPDSSLLLSMSGIYNWLNGKQQAALENFENALSIDKSKVDFILEHLPFLKENKQFSMLISD